MQQWILDWEQKHDEALPTAAFWWLRLTDAEQREWARWREEHKKHRQLAKQAERKYNRVRQRGTIRHTREVSASPPPPTL